MRTRWYAGFVQDTWRISSRLTLTPGLRYEYIGPPHEKDNLLGAFDPNAPGGLVQVGPGLTRSTLYNAEKTNFSPRLGVAWDIRGNGKTVLRAGISRLSALPATTAFTISTPFAASRPRERHQPGRHGHKPEGHLAVWVNLLRAGTSRGRSSLLVEPQAHTARRSPVSEPACCSLRNRRNGSEFQGTEVSSVESRHSARHHQPPDLGRGLCREPRLRRNPGG